MTKNKNRSKMSGRWFCFYTLNRNINANIYITTTIYYIVLLSITVETRKGQRMEKTKKTVFFTVQMEPAAKQRARTIRKAGRTITYTPVETREAESKIKAEAHAVGLVPVDLPTRAHFYFYVPIPASWSQKKKAAHIGRPVVTRPDVDNYAKLVLDALNGIAWKDDGQVYYCASEKIYSDEPRIEIVVDYETWQ